ncbi:hypothetical protein V6N12_068792 [Hibiscus sabdariffa]|uniref:Uncharacterized protein n=1 Tax=Hibiscus sabdariffa TaxID=183260 RepID=A0ABR2B0Q2_9ROSI
MAGKHTPISSHLLPKKHPNIKKKAVGEAHPEKSTTGLIEIERKKREVENPRTKRTCSKGGQTKHNPRTHEEGNEETWGLKIRAPKEPAAKGAKPNTTQEHRKKERKTKAKMSPSPSPSRPTPPWIQLPPNKNVL